MPAIANITVKKYDGTTDVVYTAVASASSDGVPAQYEAQTGFTVPATRPTFKVTSRFNGKKTSRRVNATYSYPVSYVDSTTGRTVIIGSIAGEFSMILPQDIDQVAVREAHQQCVGLLKSATMKAVFDEGTAPR